MSVPLNISSEDYELEHYRSYVYNCFYRLCKCNKLDG